MLMPWLFLAEWYAFIGRRAAPNLPGSPYAITFKSTAPESAGMQPMNVSAYSCGDTSLGCSCGDCPSALVCANTAPPREHEKSSCSVRIGSLKVMNCAVDILSFDQSDLFVQVVAKCSAMDILLCIFFFFL